EDTIRVADLKIRASRFDRVHKEVRAKPDQLISITEFMHPRYDELCSTAPAPIGAWMLRTTWLDRALSPLFRSGRRITTSNIRGFLPLFLLAGLRPWRRGTLRHRNEIERLTAWLALIRETAQRDLKLGVELAECQRLVKGYGE